MRIRCLTLVTLAAMVPLPALAQQPPPPRERRQPNERRPAPPDAPGPREAPPAPRAESPGAKAGFVWIAGEWDWRGGKYEWIPGHWERERANKRWRPSRWEQRDGVYHRVPGDWEDGGAPPVASPDRPRQPPPPPRDEKPEPAKAGFVWIAGEWDWRGGKYEWIPGHWERERANKRWRPSRWEQRDGAWTRTPGDWEDGGPPAAEPDRPRQAPPPPRAEKPEPAKAGFVWIAGEWDWRGGKYEWIPGHWERERANKRWRPSRWEQRDGAWTRTPGDWEDSGYNTGVVPPPVGSPVPRPPRRDWKIERPVVSSYWPAKGKAGTRIVIRGRNFPKDANIVFGGKPLRGVKVTDDTLTFAVPADAASGLIAIDIGRGRPLAVGTFEVAAAFDAEAERKRLEDEARKKAEAEWAERQRQLAKDRAAREAAVRQRWEQRVAQREQRRQDRLAAIQARYARAFLADAETQAELNLHAQRIAELERMTDIAEIRNDSKLAVRIEVLRTREDQRHDARMAALDAAFRAGGGAP